MATTASNPSSNSCPQACGILSLGMAALFLLVVTAMPQPQPRPPPAVTIGFMGPLQWDDAPSWRDAYETAISDLEAQHEGVSFEVIEADSNCNEETAESAANALVDAGVVAVAGALCSYASEAANGVLHPAEIPMISWGSTLPRLSDNDEFPQFYRIVPSESSQGLASADAMMQLTDETSRIAVFHTDDEWGQSNADIIVDRIDSARLCHQNAFSLDLDAIDADASDEVDALINDNCDAIHITGNERYVKPILAEIRRRQQSSESDPDPLQSLQIFIATYAGDSLQFITDAYGADANGIHFMKHRWFDDSGTGVFRSRCDDGMCAHLAAEVYDAVMMIGAAAMREDEASMDVRIRDVGVNYAGDIRTYTFDENGDVPSPGFEICKVESESENCLYTWEV